MFCQWNFLAPPWPQRKKSFSQAVSNTCDLPLCQLPPRTVKGGSVSVKMSSLWPNLKNSNIVPLCKGFFALLFNTVKEMQKLWSLRLLNLKPGILRFSCWTKDFHPSKQKLLHAQVWIQIMNLPQEYWRPTFLFEIASSLGTPSFHWWIHKKTILFSLRMGWIPIFLIISFVLLSLVLSQTRMSWSLVLSQLLLQEAKIGSNS